MSHNLTSASVVDAWGRALRKWQVDVGNSELEGFKELFKVFSCEARTTEIRQGAVAYVEQHFEDFEGFLVTEKVTMWVNMS